MATSAIERVQAQNGAGRRNHVRTTIVLPSALDQNLEIFCAREGKSKNEVVITALRTLLQKEGFQPLKQPKTIKIDVQY